MLRSNCLACFALFLAASIGLTTVAADPSPDMATQSRLPRSVSLHSMSMFSRARILVSDATRDEFKLSDAQARQIDDLLRGWSAAEDQSRGGPRLPPGQNPTPNANPFEQNQKYLERLQALLTAEQNSHLNHRLLQAEGLSLFSGRDPLAARLNLDVEQRRQVWDINRDRSASLESQMTRFLEILTPEQRGIWNELVGKDFVLPDRTPGRGRAVSLQVPNIRRPATLLRNEWVQRDLKLTAEQAAKVNASFAALDARQLELQEQMLAGARGEAWRRRIQQSRQATEEISDNLFAAISAPQRGRLEQLALQSDGLYAFRNLDVRNGLDLTPQQVRAIDGFLREFQDFATTTPQEDEAKWFEEIRLKKEQLLSAVLLLLTPDQLQKWQTLIGPAADESPDEAMK